MNKRLLSFIIITGAVILILGVLPGVTMARPVEDVTIRAPFFSTATMTYNGNPYYIYADEVISEEPEDNAWVDLNFPADIHEGSPYSRYLTTVGFFEINEDSLELITYNDSSDIVRSYYLGGIHEGEELIVNVTPTFLLRNDAEEDNYNLSTNSSMSLSSPMICRIDVSEDVVVYNVSWNYILLDYNDYSMNITFVRIKPNDPLANLTEVREFYTNVYPAHWNSPVLKVPCVLVTDDSNVVVKALILSEWDPASIGLTGQQADEWVFYTYGVWPTYV